jgi:hypothetical protein
MIYNKSETLLWRCDILFKIIIVDSLHHLSLLKLLCFGDWFCFHLQSNRIRKETYSVLHYSRVIFNRMFSSLFSDYFQSRKFIVCLNIYYLRLNFGSLPANRSNPYKYSRCTVITKQSVQVSCTAWERTIINQCFDKVHTEVLYPL